MSDLPPCVWCSYKLVGDVDFESCKPVAGKITPVSGLSHYCLNLATNKTSMRRKPWSVMY
jgi:hypothetical protein